jgi:ABC-type sugar transport system permease subunit
MRPALDRLDPEPAIYGVLSLVFSLVIGFVLAALMDQKIRFENTFRTIFLYPFALSFIVTGLVWQWILNPEFGIQSVVRSLGWESFTFDPLYNADIVIYGILIAGLWQGTGLVMCLMLAGLRGIDEDIWKAARVDGIPMWKTYLFIVIPMMRPVFITTLVIIASGIVKVYDLVVAQTGGGPGIASEVPAKYVYDYMFQAQNLGQGFAASTMMLLTVRSSSCPGPISNSEAASVADTSATKSRPLHVATRSPGQAWSARPKSARAFSRRNIMLYGTLVRGAAVYYLLPLYVMVVTSLKGMPEIRLGNIFSPPVEITFEPWVKAWARPARASTATGFRAASGTRCASPFPR